MTKLVSQPMSGLASPKLHFQIASYLLPIDSLLITCTWIYDQAFILIKRDDTEALTALLESLNEDVRGPACQEAIDNLPQQTFYKYVHKQMCVISIYIYLYI